MSCTQSPPSASHSRIVVPIEPSPPLGFLPTAQTPRLEGSRRPLASPSPPPRISTTATAPSPPCRLTSPPRSLSFPRKNRASSLQPRASSSFPSPAESLGGAICAAARLIFSGAVAQHPPSAPALFLLCRCGFLDDAGVIPSLRSDGPAPSLQQCSGVKMQVGEARIEAHNTIDEFEANWEPLNSKDPAASSGKIVFTSDHALKLESVPDWIAIVGSGYIGLEFSDVYIALGSEVTFVEALDQLMPEFDPEIAKLAQRVLINPRKIDYHTGVFASKITPAKDGKPVLIELIDAKTKEYY